MFFEKFIARHKIDDSRAEKALQGANDKCS